jgi:hypothetical protein
VRSVVARPSGVPSSEDVDVPPSHVLVSTAGSRRPGNFATLSENLVEQVARAGRCRCDVCCGCRSASWTRSSISVRGLHGSALKQRTWNIYAFRFDRSLDCDLRASATRAKMRDWNASSSQKVTALKSKVGLGNESLDVAGSGVKARSYGPRKPGS